MNKETDILKTCPKFHPCKVEPRFEASHQGRVLNHCTTGCLSRIHYVDDKYFQQLEDDQKQHGIITKGQDDISIYS